MTRCASVMAATRRGCVTAILPMSLLKKNVGICVLFPEPVAAVINVIRCSDCKTVRSISSWYAYTGNCCCCCGGSIAYGIGS